MSLAPLPEVAAASAFLTLWRPATASDQKIKKDGSGQVPALTLTENPDILATVARLPEAQRPWCVGFAAESHDVVKHAREKLTRKNVPLVVGNIGPATFGRDDNALVLVDAQGERELPRASKLSLARELVAEIAPLRRRTRVMNAASISSSRSSVSSLITPRHQLEGF